jgi:hypothetical protein
MFLAEMPLLLGSPFITGLTRPMEPTCGIGRPLTGDVFKSLAVLVDPVDDFDSRCRNFGAA